MKFLILVIALVFGNPTSVPDSKLTPGVRDPHVTQKNVQQTICVSGYTKTVRNVSVATKKKVFALYGADWAQHADYEVDHLIPLELGGSNDVKNLWPEKYATTGIGAREKDVVENDLHRRVCAGEITLRRAQDIMTKNTWLQEYAKIRGAGN